MTRKPDWQAALDRLVCARGTVQFSYGQQDCCLFVGDAILAMTGEDPAAWFRGRYRSRAEALTLVREYAGSVSIRRLAETVARCHLMPAVPILRAQRGDMALIQRGRRDFSLGIVALNGTEVMVVGPDGLLRLPLTSALLVWHI